MADDKDSEIPETGAVFTFGKSRFADNVFSKFWVRNDSVQQIDCGDEHTALVTESGRIFCFGSNEWGQLGLDHTRPIHKPTCIKVLKHEKVKLVSCGRIHTIVATDSGNIYTFGANVEGQLGVEVVSSSSSKPVLVDSLEKEKYKMLAAGADHSLALTESGKLFVWGGNVDGQLGLGDVKECTLPRQLMLHEPVTCVAAGYYHTALITVKGLLYTFGEADNGKLGLEENITADNCVPQLVSAIKEKVKSVCCGGSHTVVLTEDNEVYTFGNGTNGQLGHGTHIQQCVLPEQLKLDFRVDSIACGENHTALVSEKGNLYTFGDGRHGKLGLTQDCYSNQFKPCRVEQFDKFHVEKVVCGGCHMLVKAHWRVDLNPSNQNHDDEKIESDLNQLRINTSGDYSGSLSARDRRRQTADITSASLNRILPSLAVTEKTLPKLNTSLIVKMESKTLYQKPLPNLVKSANIENLKNGNIYEDGGCSGEEFEKGSLLEIKKTPNVSAPRPTPAPRRKKSPDLQKTLNGTVSKGEAEQKEDESDKKREEEKLIEEKLVEQLETSEEIKSSITPTKKGDSPTLTLRHEPEAVSLEDKLTEAKDETDGDKIAQKQTDKKKTDKANKSRREDPKEIETAEKKKPQGVSDRKKTVSESDDEEISEELDMSEEDSAKRRGKAEPANTDSEEADVEEVDSELGKEAKLSKKDKKKEDKKKKKKADDIKEEDSTKKEKRMKKKSKKERNPEVENKKLERDEENVPEEKGKQDIGSKESTKEKEKVVEKKSRTCTVI